MKTGIELIAEERQRQIEVEGYDAKHDFDGGFSKEEMLAWIESQGKQKIINNIEQANNKLVPKFSVGQRIRNRKREMPAFIIDRIEDDSYKGKNGESVSIAFQDDWELVEQKPAWSEEDERLRKELLGFCLECSQGRTIVNSREDFRRWTTWLKEIGDRKLASKPIISY